jgi:hypothetical protein
MKQIDVTTDIAAPAETVWRVLVDFPNHREWNPFIRSITGRVIEGGRLNVQISPPGGRGMRFRPRLLVVDEPRELRWVGRLIVRGLFDGEHAFVIEESASDRCRITQSEKFSGLFARMAGRSLEATADGFRQMNEALKSRAESIASVEGTVR